MAADHDSGDDSDFENLETPSSPPQKPANMVQFYIEQNHGRGLSNDELRTEFTETLGKQEKQSWKMRHKKVRKRYHKLLQLYQDANPSFNLELYQQRQSSPQRRKRPRESNTNSSRNNRTGGGYGRGGTFDIIDSSFEQPSSSSNGQPKRKRQKRNEQASSGNAVAHDSIDEMFRNISTGPQRAIDADKFVPTDEHKAQMTRLVEKMRESARKDWECNRAGEPAITTLQEVDSVVAELSKKLFHKYYLDDTDLLEAIRDWIHPLPDGSLPAVKIRSEMYRIIEKLELHEIVEMRTLWDYFNVSEDKSKDANYAQPMHPKLKGFSRTVMKLWAHPKETNSNKTLLRKIMEKWIRSLTGSNASYSELRESLQEDAVVIRDRYRVLQKQKGSRQFISNTKRAQIPEKAWHDFAVNPQNLVDLDGDGNPMLNRGRTPSHPMQERMNRTFKRVSSSKQAARPSITGRKTRK